MRPIVLLQPNEQDWGLRLDILNSAIFCFESIVITTNNLFDGMGQGRMGNKGPRSMIFTSANVDGSDDAHYKIALLVVQ